MVNEKKNIYISASIKTSFDQERARRARCSKGQGKKIKERMSLFKFPGELEKYN